MSLLLEALKSAEIRRNSGAAVHREEAIKLTPPMAEEPIARTGLAFSTASQAKVQSGAGLNNVYSSSNINRDRQAAQQLLQLKPLSFLEQHRVTLIGSTAGLVLLMGVGYMMWYNRQNAAVPQTLPSNNIIHSALLNPENALLAKQPRPTELQQAELSIAPVMPVSAEPFTNVLVTKDSNQLAVSQPDEIKITHGVSQSQIHPLLTQAYQAYTVKDFTQAIEAYQQMLQIEPHNRDALLGLAAIASQQGQWGTAEKYYGALLELDPKDITVQTALIELKAQDEPARVEGYLKSLLTKYPQAAHAAFVLANLYASQNRWSEAQQEYFRAYSLEPAQPDYAYNLAVSLDYLNQGKLARDYYQRAVALSTKQLAHFDQTQAMGRVEALNVP